MKGEIIMDRRKELRELYKNMKKDMGIFIIKSKFNNKCHIRVTQDLKGTMNSARFQLNFGNYPNRELQKDWKEHGESNFMVEVLEKLEYDKDETKTDYSEELNILEMVWKEKLPKEGKEFYSK